MSPLFYTLDNIKSQLNLKDIQDKDILIAIQQYLKNTDNGDSWNPKHIALLNFYGGHNTLPAWHNLTSLYVYNLLKLKAL